jgi:hypothetical protein
MEDGGKAPAGLGTLRAVLAILQWWGFNVTVIIMNKWIFQVYPHYILASPSIFRRGSGCQMLLLPGCYFSPLEYLTKFVHTAYHYRSRTRDLDWVGNRVK